MLSSTSNSRTPKGGWVRIWAWILLLTSGLVVSWEVFWQERGFRPSFRDDLPMWAYTRNRVYRGGPDTLALIGESRVLTDLHLATFSALVPELNPVQLGINMGVSPLPVLRDLAQDTKFRGRVLCSVNPLVFFNYTTGVEKRAQEWIQYWRKEPWHNRVEQPLRLFLQGHFVTGQTIFASSRQIHDLLFHGMIPEPTIHTFLRDRSVLVDFTRKEVPVWEMPMVPEDQFDSAENFFGRLPEIQRDIAAIHGRGGKVIFVRFPSSGEAREKEQRYFPREIFWDRFVAETEGLHIHYEDFPSLNRYACPDGSHLDVRDAVPFTTALVTILRDKGGL